jgi:hypothetical protein
LLVALLVWSIALKPRDWALAATLPPARATIVINAASCRILFVILVSSLIDARLSAALERQ